MIHAQKHSGGLRTLWLTAVIYGMLVAALLPLRPLWLDEVIQLLDSSKSRVSDVIAEIPRNAGAVPLGTLTQYYGLQATGYSPWKARITPALFGIGTVVLVGSIAAMLGLRRPWTAAAVYGIFPLVLRYSAEGRPYQQGVFFSALATLLFLRMADKPTVARAALYALTLAAALYTQPFSVMVAGAHLLWALWDRRLRTAVYTAIAGAVAVAAFMPWYLWARTAWKAAIASRENHFVFTLKTPLMLFRELAGANYWGTALLLILCVIAVRRCALDRRIAMLLTLLIAVPLAAGLAADAAFQYFLAIRQFLWVLPAVAIFAAFGLQKAGRLQMAVVAALVLACTVSSARYFASRHEDWDAASRVLVREVRGGACLAVAPQEYRVVYSFFAPELLHIPDRCHTVAAAVSIHTSTKERDTLLGNLAREGYQRVREQETGGTRVVIMGRR